jgi:hypothetical protein
LSGFITAGALIAGMAVPNVHAQAQPQGAQPQAAQPQAQPQAQKLTFEGDTALWTVSIKPDKTADFEKIIAKLHEGLKKSDKPEKQQQATGWKVMRLAKPLPDGMIAYVHIINPVVPGADYTVMQNLYDLFPDERLALYELYRGAFDKNLSLAVGNMVTAAPAAPAQ